jgi:hypothetical protein
MTCFSKAPFRIALAALILFAAVPCRAQRGNMRQMENRFLFVIDTSSAMRSRTNGVEEAVAGLLNSDMRGEFRKGDTLGVWTYDEELHADFPMQVWSPENKDAIARDVLRYLRHERYEKRAHLDKVLGSIAHVMEQSDRLTVIFIYDGSGLIRGTQFDTDINDLQKKYSRQFRTAHMPMVTILATRHGQAFDYTINYPNAMTVPHTAIDPPPPTNAPPPAVVAVPPPVIAVPVEPSPPHRRIEIVMSGTNLVTGSMTAAESMANNPPSAESNIVMTAPRPPPKATTTTAPPAPVVAVSLIASNPPPADTKPEPAAPQPAVIVAQQEPAPISVPASPIIVPATNALAMAPTPAVAAAPAPQPAAAPASVAAAEPPPVGVVSLPLPVPAPAPGASAGQQAALFVIAFSLLTIAVVLVIFLVRRSRVDAPSLITQSIDRGR